MMKIDIESARIKFRSQKKTKLNHIINGINVRRLNKYSNQGTFTNIIHQHKKLKYYNTRIWIWILIRTETKTSE